MIANSLTAKARCAALTMYEALEGTRTLTEEHRTNIVDGLAEPQDFSDSMVHALTVLATAAAVGVDIDQLLADLFIAIEHNPEGQPRKVVERTFVRAMVEFGA